MKDIFAEYRAASRLMEEDRRSFLEHDQLTTHFRSIQEQERELRRIRDLVPAWQETLRGAEERYALMRDAGYLNLGQAVGTSTAVRAFQQEREEWRQHQLLKTMADEAWRAAEFASGLALSDALAAHRVSQAEFAMRLAQTGAASAWAQPEYLRAFAEASAASNLLRNTPRVDREIIEANRAMATSAPPALSELAEYRAFLDAAGLTLARWPRLRLLTRAEKQRKLRNRLQNNAASPHVKRARSLVHKYELTMREIIDGAMTDAYGEDWAQERLALCGCKDLLGKWVHRGGCPLDHADYAHYSRIMCHPQHFDDIFREGFDDSEELEKLIAKAGRLRAASHHGHKFSQDDLRDLRLVWRTLEIGLLALLDDYEVDILF